MSGPTLTYIVPEQIRGLKEFVLSVKAESLNPDGTITLGELMDGESLVIDNTSDKQVVCTTVQRSDNVTNYSIDAYCTLPPTILIALVLVCRWVSRVIQRGKSFKKKQEAL